MMVAAFAAYRSSRADRDRSLKTTDFSNPLCLVGSRPPSACIFSQCPFFECRTAGWCTAGSRVTALTSQNRNNHDKRPLLASCAGPRLIMGYMVSDQAVVLVADNEASVLKNVASILQKPGFTVLKANGAPAVMDLCACYREPI